MQFNLWVIGVSAFIPLLVGFFWYGNMGFGNLWMRESEVTAEKMKNGNMFVIFGLTFVLGLFLSLAVATLTIHQIHYYSILEGKKEMLDVNSALYKETQAFMSQHGANFRSFKHGALHGFLSTLLIILPIIAINGLFERRSWKYIMLHVGYWAVTMMLMGGVICAWL
jgi:hypothetical protein